MSCEMALLSFERISGCVETAEGSRLVTHCLYPSFEPVYVYIVRVGDGFKVHDGGGAYRAAWLHGRDQILIKKMIDAECRKFHAKRENDAIFIDVESADWLSGAMLGVANASSLAAHSAVTKLVASNERQLVDRIEQVLLDAFGAAHIAREVEVTGMSGGKRRFDLIVRPSMKDVLYVNGVAAHHASVYTKYVSFSDTKGDRSKKLAVHDKILDAADVALLQQVSVMLPVGVLREGAWRAANAMNSRDR